MRHGANVNLRSCARTFFHKTYDDFYDRTRGFWSPLELIYSVLDEKGEARTMASAVSCMQNG